MKGGSILARRTQWLAGKIPHLEKGRNGMNAKHGYAGAVLLVLLAGPLVQAQTPTILPPLKDPAPSILPLDAPTGTLPPTGKPLGTPISPTAAPVPTLTSTPAGIYPTEQPSVQAVAPDSWVYQQGKGPVSLSRTRSSPDL
jgi:hypothetical protein